MERITKRGRFIVVEGVDGSGISTQAARLSQWLEIRNRQKVLLTKEPTDGPVGLLLRQALNKRLQGFSPEVLALLFAADRLDHIAQQVLPALGQGNDVVCDRYLWSSLAYQGQDIDQEWIKAINSKTHSPDITIFIRVEPEVTLDRINRNRFQVDLFEQETILHRVLANFDMLVQAAQERGERVIVIDGAKTIDTVTAEIIQLLDKHNQF
ncbi:MAG: dTMP kinase [Desulfitobacteriaceae bacterium]